MSKPTISSTQPIDNIQIALDNLVEYIRYCEHEGGRPNRCITTDQLDDECKPCHSDSPYICKMREIFSSKISPTIREYSFACCLFANGSDKNLGLLTIVTSFGTFARAFAYAYKSLTTLDERPKCLHSIEAIVLPHSHITSETPLVYPHHRYILIEAAQLPSLSGKYSVANHIFRMVISDEHKHDVKRRCMEDSFYMAYREYVDQLKNKMKTPENDEIEIDYILRDMILRHPDVAAAMHVATVAYALDTDDYMVNITHKSKSTPWIDMHTTLSPLTDSARIMDL